MARTTKKPKPSPSAAEEVTELVEGTDDAREEAQGRARAAAEEIGAILKRHRCAIMPRIDPERIEPVGMAGDKIQITATYWVAPLP